MKKIRLTMIVEYVPRLMDYPGCSTIEEMLDLDLANDPRHLFDDAEIEGEIIE